MSLHSIILFGDKCAALFRERILAHAHQQSFRSYIIVFLCGIFTTASLPPYFLLPLLPLALSTFFYFIYTASSAKQRFLRGWWFGFGFFTTSIYWFAYALLVDAEQFGWLIPFAIGGIGCILALFHATAMLACTSFFHTRSTVQHIIWFSLCLFAAEWARGNLFSGFPWNLIGYIWTFSTTSIQLGAFFGIYILTGLTVLIATLPALMFIPAKSDHEKTIQKLFLKVTILSLCALATACIFRLSTAPTTFYDGINLRIVQGNIPQSLKWDPQGRLEGIRTYAALSMMEGHDTISHIIWPESAMTYAFESQDYWAKELSTIVPPKGLLLTGTIRREIDKNNQEHLYNSLQGLDANANVTLHYNKRHLVPFGEYVPFRTILPIEKITKGSIDFSSGDASQTISAKGLPSLQPIICYESIFPELARGAYPRWLLLITNDAWFGDSSAPYQHLHMGRMRAVEQGVPLIRAANTGISAVIDSYGRILHSLPLNEEGVIDSQLPKPAGAATLFNSYELLMYIFYISGCILYCIYKKK